MGFKYNPLGFSGFDLQPTVLPGFKALTGVVAPNLAPGVAGSDGQLYTNQLDNSLWVKNGPLDTDWILESTAGSDIVSLNGETVPNQTFNISTTGTDFTITSALGVHTFNFPVASATETGKLSAADWAIFMAKLDSNSTIDGGTWV